MKQYIKKIIFATCLFFSFTFAIYSQDVPSSGITDNDVKSFIKNFDTIEKELSEIEIDLGNISNMSDIVLKEKIENILEKNGISKPDTLNKLKAIISSFAVEVYEKELSENQGAAAMMKTMGLDPVAELRKIVNADDCAIIKKHLNDLTKVLNIN